MDALLNPLNMIMKSCEALLEESGGILNPYQERFVSAIFQVANELHTLIISLPDSVPEKALEMFSYEARSNLASIIGYAEVLLDESDGALNDIQRQTVRAVRSHGSQLLVHVVHMLEVNRVQQ